MTSNFRFLPQNLRQARNLLKVGTALFVGPPLIDFNIGRAIHTELPGYIAITCMLSGILFILIGSIALIKIARRDAPDEAQRLDQTPALKSLDLSALPNKKMLRNHYHTIVMLISTAAVLLIFPYMYTAYLLDPHGSLSAKSELLKYMTVVAIFGIMVSASIGLYLHRRDKKTRINMLVQLSRFVTDNKFTIQKPGSIDEVTPFAKIYRPLITLPFGKPENVPYLIRGSYLGSAFLLTSVIQKYSFGVAVYTLSSPISTRQQTAIQEYVHSIGDLLAEVSFVDTSVVLKINGILDTDYYSMAHYFEVFAYAHETATQDVNSTT
jgi:uncharacterized membrane protein YhdT